MKALDCLKCNMNLGQLPDSSIDPQVLIGRSNFYTGFNTGQDRGIIALKISTLNQSG